MPVIGITGGIAAGKSALTALLRDYFPPLAVFDSDACARELTRSDQSILAAIRDQFGPAVFDDTGALQRSALGSIVFADAEKRASLEGILHPAIRRTWLGMAGQTRAQPGNDAWLAVDIPLLFETSAESHFDKIVVVACSARTQSERLVTGRHVNPGLARQMIDSQLPLAMKIERADFVVWNEGNRAALETQARFLSQRLFS